MCKTYVYLLVDYTQTMISKENTTISMLQWLGIVIVSMALPLNRVVGTPFAK